MDGEIVTKTEFAAIVNRTPGAVSHWIRDGKIKGLALVGEGSRAKIRVKTALDQLGLTLDLAQQAAQAEPVPAAAPGENGVENAGGNVTPLRNPSAAELLQAEKLKQAQITSRQMEEDDRSRQGIYVRADLVRAEMTKRFAGFTRETELWISDLAVEMLGAGPMEETALADFITKSFRKFRSRQVQTAVDERDSVERLVPEVSAAEDDAGDTDEEPVPAHA